MIPSNGPSGVGAPLRIRRARRIAVLVLAVAAAGLGVAVWRLWPAPPDPPAVDLAGADPAAAETVTAAREAVRRTPTSAAAWGKLGMVLLAHDFRAPAGACFAQAERLDSADPHWPYYSGYILSLDDPPASIPPLQRAVERGGDRPVAPRLRLGAALLEAGRTEEAESLFRRVLAIEPDDPQAHLQLGRAAYARGDYQESLDHLGRADDAPCTRKAAHALAAEVRGRLGDRAGAARDLSFLQEGPDDPLCPDPFLDEVGRLQRGKQARLRRADDLLAEGRLPEAVDWLRELTQDYPDMAWAWLRLGRALVQAGDQTGAEQALRTALARDPDLVDAHFYLGVVRFQGGDFRGAAASFRKATELKPDYAVAYYNLGECLLRQEDRAGATVAFRAAVENKPFYAEAHAALGAALAAAGRTAEAREQLQDAIDLDPADRRSRDLLEELKKKAPE